MTTTMREAATAFLAHKRIAVTGVSRTPAGHGANAVYKRLRARGYEVFAVNPNADQVEGDHCYHSLGDIPGGVKAVVIATSPEHAQSTMRDCVDHGVEQTWMHRGLGQGSVSPAAVAYGRKHGTTVIDGGCPCMFAPTADPGHKLIRFLSARRGTLPKLV